jgi:hypothetical protein
VGQTEGHPKKYFKKVIHRPIAILRTRNAKPTSSVLWSVVSGQWSRSQLSTLNPLKFQLSVFGVSAFPAPLTPQLPPPRATPAVEHYGERPMDGGTQLTENFPSNSPNSCESNPAQIPRAFRSPPDRLARFFLTLPGYPGFAVSASRLLLPKATPSSNGARTPTSNLPYRSAFPRWLVKGLLRHNLGEGGSFSEGGSPNECSPSNNRTPPNTTSPSGSTIETTAAPGNATDRLVQPVRDNRKAALLAIVV